MAVIWGVFPDIFQLLTSNLIPRLENIQFREYTVHDLKLFNIIGIFWPRIWSLLANNLCVTENNVS